MENKTVQNDKWEINANRFVAYLDIMGFKDMVARMKSEDIYILMKKLRDVLHSSTKIDWSFDKMTYLDVASFSDSIIIYSKDDSSKSLENILCSLSSIISEMLLCKIPFRGALSWGKMILDRDNSIVFGQPLIDSYFLQEELNFYGIVLHASAEYKISRMKKEDLLTPTMFLQLYDCPFKNGKSNNLTIFPMRSIIYEGKEKESEDDCNKILKSVHDLRYRTSGSLRKYIENTEEYLKYIKKNDLLDVLDL